MLFTYEQDETRTPCNVNGFVLAFHKVSPQFSFGSTNYSPQRCDRLFRWLQSSGWQFVSLADLIKETASTNFNIAITFDDGYKHLTRYLPPLIDKYHIRPTIFVPTVYIGRDNIWDYSSMLKKEQHLSIDDIKHLTNLGVEFGSHGHSHLDLTRIKQKNLMAELSISKRILEEITEQEITSISYPFGRVNPEVVVSARSAGYKYGLTMKLPQTCQQAPLLYGRIAIYGFDTLLSIHQRLSHGPLYPLESIKAHLTNRLSGGTTLFNRLFRRNLHN